jgi:hypothetical protein
MSDPPYREDPFEPVELVVGLGGRSGKTRYRLERDALSAESIETPGPRRRLVLADVVAVQLAAMAGVTLCTLRARDGTTLAFSSGMPSTPRDAAHDRAYGAMLAALHDRIAAASPDARFVAGSWATVGAVAVVAAIVGGLLAWLAQDPASRALPRFYIACAMLALIVLVALPLAIVRGRPRPYAPRKIPRAYDAMPR